VLELVRAGRPVRVVAELGLAEATVYRWKAQDRVDRGVKPGRSASERGELAAAKHRIKELETELALVKQAATLFAADRVVDPAGTPPLEGRAGAVLAELFRRLQVRWDGEAGRWFAFVLVACAVVCFNRL
jgi:transposase